MGTTQKVVMFKRTPHLPFNLISCTFLRKKYINTLDIYRIIVFKSKSVFDLKEKSTLFICNMMTHISRKRICESSKSKCNLSSPQTTNSARADVLK